MLYLIIFMILLPLVLKAQDRYLLSHDTWNSTSGAFIKYDKIEHFIGGIITYLIFRHVFKLNVQDSSYWSFVFWSMWEHKDALLSYKKYGFWGGDGFSYRDLIASTGGIMIGVIFKL